LAGWALLLFGTAYMVWGIHKAIQNKIHSHLPKGNNLTPWALFIIFVLGPCEILIPLVMEPAIRHNVGDVVAVALLFSVITIATMCATVVVGYYGLKILPSRHIQRYLHAIAGGIIDLSGAAILFLGL
jgi:threonine/homoserine/homoserine lactone efflux protein